MEDITYLVFLHKIINGFLPSLTLPHYLSFFTPSSRRVLRSCHLDSLSLVSSVTPQISHSYNKDSAGASEFKIFENSFFYRTHLLWNRLPIAIRIISKPSPFKVSVIKFLWQEGFSEIIEDYDDQDLPLMSHVKTPLPPSLLLTDLKISIDAE